MSANQKISNSSAIGDRAQTASAGEGALTHVHAVAALMPLIVHNARDLIAILDTAGRRIYNSPSYAPLLGDPEELVGNDSFEDIHPEDRERVREIFRDTVRTGAGQRAEYRLIARDGTVRVIQTEGGTIRDNADRVAGVVVVGRDVTEERQSAAQLDAALRRQKALAEFTLFALRDPGAMHVIERATALVTEALNVDFGAALELEPDGVAFRVIAGHNWPQDRLGLRIGAGPDTQAGYALELYRRSGTQGLEAPQPVAIEDLRADGRFAHTFRVRELGVISAVCVVIPAAERPFGMITAHSRTRRRFEPIEIEFMQAVANVLSAALDRCQSHAALRESEDRYRDLVEHSQDLICTHHLDGRIVSVNPWAAKVLGYEPAELLNMNVRDVLTPKRRPEFEGYIDRIKKDGVASGLMVVQTRTGEKRLWKYANSLRTEGVPVPIVRGMAHDVTEQMRAEAALRKSEERFRSLTGLSSDWYWEQNAELRFTSLSEGFFRKSGMRREEVLGKRRWELFGASPPDGSWDAHRAVLEARLPFRDFAFSRAAADGTEHYQSISGEPVFDDHHVFTGYRGTGRDITGRHRAEQALRENRRLLARAQEIAGLGYWEYDLAAGAGRASRELRGMLGIPDDLPPQTLEWSLNMIHPDDRERIRAIMERSIKQGISYEFETRITTLGGAQRIMFMSGEAVKGDAGRITKLIGTCLDITEQRRREEDLCDAADELQALSRRLVEAEETERRRIAAELHDRVGQNLTALSINLDILAGKATGFDADAKHRLRESLDLLDATALCVEGVLDDLRPPMLDDWGLGPTLRWVGDEFRRRTETPVHVQVLGTERRIDSETEIALLRIVQEALNNVAKHAGARQVEIALGWEQDAVRVEVADDGVGFEPTEIRGARGLGIITMRERVQAANGRLNIDSAPGKGTRVRALIPR